MAKLKISEGSKQLAARKANKMADAASEPGISLEPGRWTPEDTGISSAMGSTEAEAYKLAKDLEAFDQFGELARQDPTWYRRYDLDRLRAIHESKMKQLFGP